jgi:NTE family protein
VAAHNSAGSWNGSSFSKFIANLEDSNVRQERFAWKFRALWLSWWLSMAPIDVLLRKNLPAIWSALLKPLWICATDDKRGREMLFHADSAIPVIEAVKASMAISGVFEPITIHGQKYSDGGTTGNITWPDDLGEYQEIIVLIASRPVGYQGSMSIIGRLMRNLDLMMQDQIHDALRELKQTCDRQGRILRVIWPGVYAPKGTLHFEHGLIAEAYVQAKLAIGGWK